MQVPVMPGLVRQARRLRLSPVVTVCFSLARRVHAPATQLPQGSHVKDIRNIGIIAHVDAVGSLVCHLGAERLLTAAG